VHGISKTAAKLNSLKAESPTINTYCVDMTHWGDLRKVVDSMPAMDGCVNNAGVGMHALFVEATEEQYDGLVHCIVIFILL
jgi:short-subunit dehydrogenase